MPKISIAILTKDRAGLLQKALQSVMAQRFQDFEIVVVNDGSADDTLGVLEGFSKTLNLKILNHKVPLGITAGRQEALGEATGEYVAFLDDDDEWTDEEKLGKQVKFLDEHPDYVLVGGGIRVELGSKSYELRMRPETDAGIRKTMLYRNNFFTSTVMFRRSSALLAGGFLKNAEDAAEDYDLWLRLGKLGKMYNFQQAFANYRLPDYNNQRKRAFLSRQLQLIKREKANYPGFWPASILLRLRILL